MADYDERLRHRLELQAMQIEQLMLKHGVQVEVQGGTVRDGGVNIDAQAVMALGLERLRGAGQEMARVLGVDKVHLEWGDGRLRIHYRRRPKNAVELLPLIELISEELSLAVPLGIDFEARPVMLRLDDFEGGNVLIAGGEKAGKTSLLRTIVAGLASCSKQSEVQLLAISASGRVSGRSRYALGPLEHFPHFAAPVVGDQEEAVEALGWLNEEAAFREANGIERPLLILVVDDLDLLLRHREEEVLDLLGRLLDARPAAGVRILMSASDLLSEALRGLLRHNVGLRLVGHLPSERDARAAAGTASLGADLLPGNGAFIAVAGAKGIRFQAAFIDDYDLHLLIEKAYRRHRHSLLAIPVAEATPELPADDLADEEISFQIDNGTGRAAFETLDQSEGGYHEVWPEQDDDEWPGGYVEDD
jgi:DNA segregation ATPase FtsK/SpoIIIE-like protein